MSTHDARPVRTPAGPGASDLEAYCLGILEGGSLADKLVPPPADLADRPGRSALHVDRPVRQPGLDLRGAAGRLPPLGRLADPAAAAACLARFAHHELMAVELFAWALLRWPELPDALKRGWLHTLADEQRHLRMYEERLGALGSSIAEHPCSDYFWRQAPAIAASAHGPKAFLCAMGLTLEQANLDFSALYADAFRRVGDVASAEVCERVHEDEIGHVRQAVVWTRRLDGCDSDLEAYRRLVPAPFEAARAKGRRFVASARQRAGLSEAFIAFVRDARPESRRS